MSPADTLRNCVASRVDVVTGSDFHLKAIEAVRRPDCCTD